MLIKLKEAIPPWKRSNSDVPTILIDASEAEIKPKESRSNSLDSMETCRHLDLNRQENVIKSQRLSLSLPRPPRLPKKRTTSELTGKHRQQLVSSGWLSWPRKRSSTQSSLTNDSSSICSGASSTDTAVISVVKSPKGIHSAASSGHLQSLVAAYLKLLRVPVVGDMEQHELSIPAHLFKPLRSVIDLRNRRGMTPLHGACYYGHEDVCEWLLKRGADPNLRAGIPADKYKDMGGTALHFAAVLGHLKICYLLAYYGADLWARDSRGCLAVDIARLHGHHRCVKWLSKLMLCGSGDSRVTREENIRILKRRSLSEDAPSPLPSRTPRKVDLVMAFWTPDTSGITMPLDALETETSQRREKSLSAFLHLTRIKT